MEVALIVGGPGAGKTTEALRIMDKILETDVTDPMQIGFVSFTRAARREASMRAAEKFGITAESLENQGWFRTIHSVCHKAMNVQKDQMLTGDAKSRRWFEDVLQEEAAAAEDTESASPFADLRSPAAKVIGIWDLCRNRIENFAETWKRCYAADHSLPPLETCWALVQRYEAAKLKDGKLDFTDLLCRAANMDFSTGEPLPGDWKVDLPCLPAWLLDETQDNSKLVNGVCLELAWRSRWVYVFGDPSQSIFGWAGADADAIDVWAHSKKKILDQSYRCTEATLSRARDIIRRTKRWQEHEFRPRCEGGEYNQLATLESLVAAVNPNEDTLILGRTNYLASILAERLEETGMPWRPTRGRGGFDAPKRVSMVRSVRALLAGKSIKAEEWRRILAETPSMHEGQRLVTHGAKQKWEDVDFVEKAEPVTLASMTDPHNGATPALRDGMQRDLWHTLFMADSDKLIHVWNAIDRYGDDRVCNPQIRVGTIHSAKGAEADHVILWNALTQQTVNATRDAECNDEERRVWYVAMTRARQRMTTVRLNARDAKTMGLTAFRIEGA